MLWSSKTQETTMFGIILIAALIIGAWVRWTLDLDGVRARHQIITGEKL